MRPKHPFELYFQRHGHYPRLRFNNGIQTVTVEFAPGYVHVKTSPPFSGEVYLTSNCCRAMAREWRRILSLIRRQDRVFDVPKAVQEYSAAEKEHLDELRRQKRERRGPRTRRKRT
jgi:hypothetical protein